MLTSTVEGVCALDPLTAKVSMRNSDSMGRTLFIRTDTPSRFR